MASAGDPRWGLAQVSAAGVLWGTGGLAVQVVRQHAPLSPLTISAYRLVVAALVLLVAVAITRRRRDVLRLLTSSPRAAVVVGLLTAAYQALYFTAVTTVGVTVSTVVSLGLAPVLLSLVDAVRRRAAPRRRERLVVTGALVGLVCVSLGAGHGVTGPHPVVGVVASVASGTAYAAATFLGEPVARRVDPLSLTTVTTVSGAVLLVPCVLVAAALSGESVVTGDPTAIAVLVYLGTFTMALAYGALYAGLRTTTPSAAVVATLLEPLTAAVLAALLLGERLGPLGIVGGVLILAAVASLGARPPPPVMPA